MAEDFTFLTHQTVTTMRSIILILILLLSVQDASAGVERLTLYFKGETEELSDSSRMDLETLIRDMEQGAEFKWLELYSFAEQEESARATRISQKRSKTICNLLKIDEDSLSIQNLGNVQCRINFEISGWNRIDLYFSRVGEQPLIDATPIQPDSIRQREIIVQLFFKGNSTDVRYESFTELQRIAMVFHENPQLKAEIRGHVCCGNNIILSRKRAREIYLYLIKNGVDKSRLSFRGYGNKAPLVTPELSDQDRSLNRRIEVVFTVPVTNSETYALNQD